MDTFIAWSGIVKVSPKPGHSQALASHAHHGLYAGFPSAARRLALSFLVRKAQRSWAAPPSWEEPWGRPRGSSGGERTRLRPPPPLRAVRGSRAAEPAGPRPCRPRLLRATPRIGRAPSGPRPRLTRRSISAPIVPFQTHAPPPQPVSARAPSGGSREPVRSRGRDAALMPAPWACAVAGCGRRTHAPCQAGRFASAPLPAHARCAAAGAGGCPARGARSPPQAAAPVAGPRAGSASVGDSGWGKGPPPGLPPSWGAAGAAPLAGPGAPPDPACGAARGACRGGRAALGRGERRHEEPLRAPAVNGRRGGAGGAGAAAAAMAQEKMELDLELPPGSAAAPSDGGGLRRSNSAPLIHGLR